MWGTGNGYGIYMTRESTVRPCADFVDNFFGVAKSAHMQLEIKDGHYWLWCSPNEALVSLGHEKVLSKLFAIQFKTNTFVVGRTSCMAGYMHEDISTNYSVYFRKYGCLIPCAYMWLSICTSTIVSLLLMGMFRVLTSLNQCVHSMFNSWHRWYRHVKLRESHNKMGICWALTCLDWPSSSSWSRQYDAEQGIEVNILKPPTPIVGYIHDIYIYSNAQINWKIQ